MWQYEKSVKEYFTEKYQKELGEKSNLEGITVYRDDGASRTDPDERIGVYDIVMSSDYGYIGARSCDLGEVRLIDAYTYTFCKSDDEPKIGLREASTAFDFAFRELNGLKDITDRYAAKDPFLCHPNMSETVIAKEINVINDLQNQTAKRLNDVIEKAGKYIDKACSQEYRKNLSFFDKRELDKKIESYAKSLKIVKGKLNTGYSIEQSVKDSIGKQVDSQHKQIEKSIGLER
jgi:uncharacterized protein (UPF0216 family)